MAVSETMTLDRFAEWCKQQGLVLQNISAKLQPAYKALAPLAVAGMKEGYAQSTAPDGSTWAAPRYRAGRPLRDHGIMMGAASAVETPTGVKAFNPSKQARLHQYGGTVKPTRAKMLAIPLTAEAKRVDGARFFPRDLFVLKSKNSNKAFLAETGGLKGRGKQKAMELVLHYILVNQVKIPARPHVGFSEKTLDRMSKLLQDYALKLMTEGHI